MWRIRWDCKRAAHTVGSTVRPEPSSSEKVPGPHFRRRRGGNIEVQRQRLAQSLVVAEEEELVLDQSVRR